MNKPPPARAGANYVLDTRPLLNFVYTDALAVLEELLGKPLYVPAAVHGQFGRAESALRRRLEQLPEHQREPFDVQVLIRLQAARGRFRGNPFRIVRLHNAKRDLAIRLEREPGVDPGESEVLALSLSRGWVAILDDRLAHDFAASQGIETLGTLDLLVQAVRHGILPLDDGERLLEEMRLGWQRAPRGNLRDYLNGRRAIW